MRTLTHKGYGRIYCESEGDVEKVKDVIREMDEFEFGYLPKDMITPASNYPRVVYVGKFSDLDMAKLTAECWKRGLKIWVFDAGHDDFPDA